MQSPKPGTYVLRVHNYASVAPEWTLTASLYDQTDAEVPGLIEAWTLTCEKGGKILEAVPLIVDRGQQAKVDLKTCISKSRRSAPLTAAVRREVDGEAERLAAFHA